MSKTLLANAAALTRRTRIAARGRISFTVGFMPGLVVTEAVQALEFAHPGLSVSVLRTGWDDQTDVVHDGRVDVSYVRQPVNSRGLRIPRRAGLWSLAASRRGRGTAVARHR